ncbi:MAG: VOC family protein [Bryobacteraceae bacterium]
MTTSADDRIDPALSLGPVHLAVADLGRSERHYRDVLGLDFVPGPQGHATLVAHGAELVRLREIKGATPAPDSSPGLYHFALLLPTRADLANFARHIISGRHRIQGTADHLVSESFYLSDPDQHGIEVYADRPRSAWQWDRNTVRMAVDPLDLKGLLLEPEKAPIRETGLPAGTAMGHVHLRVADLAATQGFYADVLAFDITASLPGALFASAGGYHHHFGLNIWHSRGGAPAPPQSAHLERIHIRLSGRSHLDDLARRLTLRNIPSRRTANSLEVRDPSGILLLFEAH